MQVGRQSFQSNLCKFQGPPESRSCRRRLNTEPAEQSSGDCQSLGSKLAGSCSKVPGPSKPKPKLELIDPRLSPPKPLKVSGAVGWDEGN